MPVPRTWLPRIDEILQILTTSKEDTLDRCAIEKLFEIQRRTALLLMKQVGPLPSGFGFLVERKALIKWVKNIQDTESHELGRRQRLSRQIDESTAPFRAARQVLKDYGRPPMQFPVVQEMLTATIASLPREIHIHAGKITIESTDQKRACQLLYSLGLAIANDPDGFADALSDECMSVQPDERNTDCITEPS